MSRLLSPILYLNIFFVEYIFPGIQTRGLDRFLPPVLPPDDRPLQISTSAFTLQCDFCPGTPQSLSDVGLTTLRGVGHRKSVMFGETRRVKGLTTVSTTFGDTFNRVSFPHVSDCTPPKGFILFRVVAKLDVTLVDTCSRWVGVSP